MKNLCVFILSGLLFISSAGALVVYGKPRSSSTVTEASNSLGSVEARFYRANASHDGKLTRDQAAVGMPVVAEHFNEIDATRNGYVTRAQVEAFLQEQSIFRRN